jgi:hypothetical protein
MRDVQNSAVNVGRHGEAQSPVAKIPGMASGETWREGDICIALAVISPHKTELG